MLINKEVAKMIAEQTSREASASNTYYAASLWCKANGFPNSAKFFEASSADETKHRNMQLDFLADMSDSLPVVACGMEAKAKYEDLCSVFRAALDLEIEVTDKVNAIYSKIVETKDWTSEAFWRWFTNEQLESLRELTELVARCEATDEDQWGFDEELEVG